jgi:molybdenum cofactor synthesis domain-containing protein
MNTKNNLGFKCTILICSDRAFSGERPDETAPLLNNRLEQSNIEVVSVCVVPDNKEKIMSALQKWINEGINLILTSGGTGLAPTDVTPEATLAVIDRRVPGMEEEMRRMSMVITSHAMISRAVVGIKNQSLIINLPGKPKGAVENLQAVESVLEHGLELIRGVKVDK